MIAAAAWAGVGTTQFDRAAAPMTNVEAIKIARVDFQFIGFLFRSDAAAKPRSRITNAPKNPTRKKCEAVLFDILLGTDKAYLLHPEPLRIGEGPGHRIIFGQPVLPQMHFRLWHLI